MILDMMMVVGMMDADRGAAADDDDDMYVLGGLAG